MTALTRGLAALIAGSAMLVVTACSGDVAPQTPADPSAAAAAQPAAPAPGQGQPPGYLQLGHLAPQAPSFNGYFAVFGEDGKLVGSGGYPALAPYQALPPGRYVWSMRPADAPPNSPLTLTKLIDVKSGESTTVALFNNGENGALQGVETPANTSAPPPGMGKLRILQGAAGDPLSITVGQQPPKDLAYGAVTPYEVVPAGRMTVQSPASGAPLSVDVQPGSLTTVMATRTDQGVQLSPVTDVIPGAGTPAGPGTPNQVNSGDGGQATAALTVAVLSATGALLLAVAAMVLRTRWRTVVIPGRPNRR